MEELESPQNLLVNSYGSVYRHETANTGKEKLIVREVMSFVCTDSCETGIYTGTELEKGTGKSAFLEYLGFQSKCTGIVPVY